MKTQNKEPNIRFSQFKGLWKVVKLDSISQKVKSKNINNTFENVLTNSAEFGIIPQRDFFDKDIANLKSLSGYYVVQPNDFVYNPRISNKAPVGPIKANFLNSTGVMSPLYYVFRTRDIDVFFLAKYFDSSYWHKFMKLNGDTGARSDRFAIKDSVFKEMPIPFPSYSEQSAIGSLFRTLDDLLSSYKDNLANYQSLKTTMLSKMFPKAGQTVPEIRLDGFEGEWKFIRLGKVLLEAYQGINTTSDKVEYSVSGIPILQAKHITNGQINYKDTRYLDMDIYEHYISKYMPKKGEILFANIGTIGPSVLVDTDELFLIAWNILKMSIKDNYSPVFIKLTLSLLDSKHIFERITTGNATKFINKDEIMDIRISVPSLPEQQAIGAYFSNLDNLINSHQEKISQLETLKKRLLQDMFI